MPELAVEVDAGAEVETAEGAALHVLRQADRVGHGHEHDLALDGSHGFQGREAFDEALRHQHRGHLVGMQRGLEVGLAAGGAGTEVQAAHTALRAGAGGRQVMDHGSHVSSPARA